MDVFSCVEPEFFNRIAGTWKSALLFLGCVVLMAGLYLLIFRLFSKSTPLTDAGDLELHVDPPADAVNPDPEPETAPTATPLQPSPTPAAPPSPAPAGASPAPPAPSPAHSATGSNVDGAAVAPCRLCGERAGHQPACVPCPCTEGCTQRALAGRSVGASAASHRCPHCGHLPVGGFFGSTSVLRRHVASRQCRKAQGVPFRSSEQVATPAERRNARTRRSACGKRWECDLCGGTSSFANRWSHIRFLCPQRRSKVAEGAVEYAL